MQDQATQLRRVIAPVERIQRSCRGANLNSRPLCLSDITPKLDLPAVHTFLPTALSNTLGGIQRTGIVRAIEHSIGSFRQDALIAFRTTVRHLRSLEDVTGVPDSTLEQRHCSLFETRYFQHIESVREHVREAVWAYVHAKGGEASKKGNGFGPVSVHLNNQSPPRRPSG